MEPERQPSAFYDFVADRVGVWFAVGSFGAALGAVAALLFARTGGEDNRLAALLGLTAALALAAVAEVGFQVRDLLRKR